MLSRWIEVVMTFLRTEDGGRKALSFQAIARSSTTTAELGC